MNRRAHPRPAGTGEDTERPPAAGTRHPGSWFGELTPFPAQWLEVRDPHWLQELTRRPRSLQALAPQARGAHPPRSDPSSWHQIPLVPTQVSPGAGTQSSQHTFTGDRERASAERRCRRGLIGRYKTLGRTASVRHGARPDKCADRPRAPASRPSYAPFCLPALFPLLPLPLRVPRRVGLYSSVHSRTPPGPGSPGMQYYQLQSPGWSSWKWYLWFFDRPSVSVPAEVCFLP